jgi:hypothetical protein
VRGNPCAEVTIPAQPVQPALTEILDFFPAFTARLCLQEAWQRHHQARAAAQPATLDVGSRLRPALDAQERHLRQLSIQLRLYAPPLPIQGQGEGDAARASRYLLSAEDAIDAAEDAGTQPRRLASWRPRGRNALVYTITAAVISAPAAFGLMTSSSWGRLALVAVQCLLLPWLSLTIGALVIGRLFRPWLGGPVHRSPVVGAIVVFAIHAATAATLLSIASVT